MTCRLIALILSLSAIPAVAQDGLPRFDPMGGYRVLGPFGDDILVQSRRGVTFLCEAEAANIVLLSDCRPVLTAEEVDAYIARQTAQERARTRAEETARLAELPPVIFERAARRVLSREGCQVQVPSNGPVEEDVLLRFARELDIDRRVGAEMLPLLDELFTESLDLLLGRGDITFDRGSRLARLVECEQ